MGQACAVFSSKPLALDIFMIRRARPGWCPFTGWHRFAHGAIEDGARRDKAVFWRLLLLAPSATLRLLLSWGFPPRKQRGRYYVLQLAFVVDAFDCSSQELSFASVTSEYVLNPHRN